MAKRTGNRVKRKSRSKVIPKGTKRKPGVTAKRPSSRLSASGQAGTGEAFAKLAAVMARLRAPGGCPWDREQTHATLRTYLIEEAYEVLDALDAADDRKFAEELGDLLLQVLFHAQIAAEEGRFGINDVIREIHDKMVRRHPHVFGDTSAKTSAEVLKNWEQIKKQERASQGKGSEETKRVSVLDGVAKSLPALLEGYQLTQKAARIGFDWDSVDGIFAKLDEESGELHAALRKKEPVERIEGEVGDILFVAVNLARYLKIDPEIAMKKASRKFARRFHRMEEIAQENGTPIERVPRRELEALWETAKHEELAAEEMRRSK